MCLYDVVLYDCEHYTPRRRQCPQFISSGLDCSPPVINTVVTNHLECSFCVMISGREISIKSRESRIRRYQKFLDSTVCPRGRASGENLIANVTRYLNEAKARLETFRGQRQQSPRHGRITDLAGNAMILAIVKFKMQELQSILIANDDHMDHVFNDDD